MSDFASSAMLRVLHAGMRRQGLASPAQAWLQSAKVPLDAKRQLVGQVLAQRGWVGVLKLGEGVQDVQGEVLMNYLAASAEPQRILQAWLRLERYVHSRHRMWLTYLSEQHVQIHHYSLMEGQAPTPAEDVVVMGVLLGLLQRCGLQGLQFAWEPAQDWWDWGRDQDVASALAKSLFAKTTADFQIRWEALERDQLLNALPVHQAWPDAGVPTAWIDGGAWSRKVADWIGQQLLQSRLEMLSLQHAAQSLAISERGLQRYLQTEGLRFVDVIGQVRVNLAASQLRHGASALAEVGFSSGFADQAHFCREFKRRVGMSPLQFREQAKQKKSR